MYKDYYMKNNAELYVSQYQAWRPIEDLLEDLQIMITIPFSLEDNKADSSENERSLKTVAHNLCIKKKSIFGPNTRFPSEGAYINLDAYEYVHEIPKLLGNLDSKSPFDQLKDNECSNCEYKKTLQDYYKAFADFKTFVNGGIGVYTRATFEQRYGLEWESSGE
jgi:hypothetical protein